MRKLRKGEEEEAGTLGSLAGLREGADRRQAKPDKKS